MRSNVKLQNTVSNADRQPRQAHIPAAIADKLLRFSVSEASTEKALTEQVLSDVCSM